MRGIDVTPEQMEAARSFIERQMLNAPPKPEDSVSHRFEDLVRLVAWYGAIRYKGALDGVGTLENPGPAESVVEMTERRMKEAEQYSSDMMNFETAMNLGMAKESDRPQMPNWMKNRKGKYPSYGDIKQ